MDNRKLAIASVFSDWALSGQAYTMTEGHKRSTSIILKSLNDHAYNSIEFLDIGCGTGWAVRHAAEQYNFCCAYGIDLSNEMIELASIHSQSYREHYQCVDFMTWETNRMFDVVFSMESLYYMPSIENAISKIFMLLRPGGTVLIGTDYYYENTVSREWPNLVKLALKVLPTEAWLAMLNDAGFIEIKKAYICDKSSRDAWKREHGTLFISAQK